MYASEYAAPVFQVASEEGWRGWGGRGGEREGTGIVPPSRTNRGGCPHSAATARSAMRNRVDSGSASHQSPVLRRVTATLLAERSLRNSCSTCALWVGHRVRVWDCH